MKVFTYTNDTQHRPNGILTLGNLLCLISCMLILPSCSEQYNISGDSSVTTLDGRMLYLKIPTANDAMHSLDSCEVVHGKFNFMGMVDSTVMGAIYMDNDGMMPIVVENGNVSILINDTEQKVVGGVLNKRLYNFIEAKSRIEDDIMNLASNEANMILAGYNPMAAHHQVAHQSNKLYNQLEKLETDFISSNSTNILGYNYFMMLCSQYPYPIMTSQIEKILKNAGRDFNAKPFVRSYVKAAETNMKLLRQDNRSNIQQVNNRFR